MIMVRELDENELIDISEKCKTWDHHQGEDGVEVFDYLMFYKLCTQAARVQQTVRE